MNKSEIGSFTAKGGFKNEIDICKKFNNYKKDVVVHSWLTIMGYDLKLIEQLQAIQIPTVIKKSEVEKYNISIDDYLKFVKFKKADAQIKIMIKIGNIWKIENLSLKKANSNADYNQVDKRNVDSYKEIWKFNDNITTWLKLFSGELLPSKNRKLVGIVKVRDSRRLFIDEMPESIQKEIIDFFQSNKIMIISDILKGRGGLSAGWMLVTKYNQDLDKYDWVLKNINETMNFFGKGEVKISPRGSLSIGRITMQRKGGTPDPTKLQFKFKPCDLFEMNK